jgi:hypothetical protein
MGYRTATGIQGRGDILLALNILNRNFIAST